MATHCSGMDMTRHYPVHDALLLPPRHVSRWRAPRRRSRSSWRTRSGSVQRRARSVRACASATSRRGLTLTLTLTLTSARRLRGACMVHAWCINGARTCTCTCTCTCCTCGNWAGGAAARGGGGAAQGHRCGPGELDHLKQHAHSSSMHTQAARWMRTAYMYCIASAQRM